MIPLIESRFPAAKTAVSRTADMARATCDLFERQTEQVTDNIEILEAGDGRHPGALRLARAALASLPDPLLQYALEEVFATAGVGPSFERLTRSTQAIRSGRAGIRVTLDDRVMLEVGYQHVYVYGAAFTDRVLEPQEIGTFPTTVDWFRRRLTFEEKAPSDVPSDLREAGAKEAWFDLDVLQLPLSVRHARARGSHERRLADMNTSCRTCLSMPRWIGYSGPAPGRVRCRWHHLGARPCSQCYGSCYGGVTPLPAHCIL